MRSNAKYRVLSRQSVTQYPHITSDQTIAYTSNRTRQYDVCPVRRVGYRDPVTGKHYIFITNHFDWSTQTIADIYKQRWQVELFFKWIKQNLKIKAFLGNTDNTVITQVLIALCVYLILSLIKHTSQIKHSLQQMISLMQTNLFAKRSLIDLFKPPPDNQTNHNQITLAL